MQGVDARYLRRVLFVRTDRLGETLLNIPAVMLLARAFPDIKLTWLANPALVELLSMVEGLDRVIPEEAADSAWVGRTFRLASQWKRQSFDAVLISNAKKEYHLAAWLAGIPVRIGYDRKWGRLLTHRLPDERTVGFRHELACNLDLLRPFGLAPDFPPTAFFSIGRKQEEVCLKKLQTMGINGAQPTIAIHPWSSNPKKQWPREQALRLIERLVHEGACKVAVIGGEEHEGEGGRGGLAAGAVDLVGRLSLPELAAFLKHVQVLVSTDSGPMHLASALGTATIALFGTQDAAVGPLRWGPWGAHHTVICKAAMEQINADEVLQAVLRHLASRAIGG